MKFSKFKPSKTLPATIIDFVLRDHSHGIVSTQFEQAIQNGDAQNISEGIDSIILNAETKKKIKLTEHDRLMVHLIAQDEIVEKLFNRAEENLCG